MYRSGWAQKQGQERILSIDIKRDAFDYIIHNAVPSKYQIDTGVSYDEWQELIKKTDVICQWDPERDEYGTPLDYRSLQIGIRGRVVEKYVNEWIVHVEDITDFVQMLFQMRNNGEEIHGLLPNEKSYIIFSE